MSQAKPKVLACVLTGLERQNWINPELSQMLFRMAKDQRFDVELATIKDARPFEVARNHALCGARDHGFDWCVQFDNDNFMPAGTPLDIIASAGPEQNVIGLTYGTIATPGAMTLLPPPAPSTGPFREVPAVAGGVLMVHRSVWQKIPKGPWFRWKHGEDNETLDRGQNGCGEDAYFCELAREHGLRVWTYSTMLAGHYRSVDLTQMTVTLSQLTQRPQPAPMRSPLTPPSRWITPPVSR